MNGVKTAACEAYMYPPIIDLGVRMRHRQHRLSLHGGNKFLHSGWARLAEQLFLKLNVYIAHSQL